jgi:hypothetical protein
MLAQFLDRIGDWNPQLMRELKCRLNLSNIAIATVISILAQALVFILPDRMIQRDTPYWWLNVCELLDREIWFALTIGGIYLVARDFDREIRMGTLDLVNLSPAKPLEIVWGKLLGVPILIYWAVLLALPLHTIALVQMAVPNAWVWDAIGLILIGLLDLCTVLVTILSSLPAIILSLVFPAIGWSGLAMITSSQISQRITGSYAHLGIYFPEEWLVVSTVAATFLAIGYTLSILIQSWYPSVNSRSPRRPYVTSFLLYSFLSFVYLILLTFMPQPMLVMTIGMSVTITMIQLGDRSRSPNSTIP